MNLVAKEYIASKRNSPGVLILSEMAGAALELNQAIIINPNDINQIEESIVQALRMPVEEQMTRLRIMQKRVEKYDVKWWAHKFVGEIQNMHIENTKNDAKVLSPELIDKITEDYKKSKKRLLLFDYDGTLSAFYNHSEEAYPRQSILDLLKQFKDDKKNHLLLNSGRDRKNLEDWFGALSIDLEAEHGAAYKKEGVWHERVVKIDWNKELLNILQSFVDSTPGAYLEEKETALVWHFRNVDNWIGILREKQLMNALSTLCSRLGLQVMRGNKIVEIKTALISKSTGTEELLKENDYDFILCLGDDVTDEDMFRILPNSAYSVKIGKNSDIAKYNIPLQEDVHAFLQQLLD
ncbi:MAG: trehalose-phosphatase, partial [Bacteroidaceae bacterium]